MSTSSSSDSRSAVNSPRTSSPAPATDDEEVNLEYLRNVILQFLEHKEMRVSIHIFSIPAHAEKGLPLAASGKSTVHNPAFHSPRDEKARREGLTN